VPLDAEEGIPQMLDRFDGAVFRASARSEIRADGLNRLMMDAVHSDVPTLFHSEQLRSGLDADVVNDPLTLGHQVRLRGVRRQMLYQGSSERDIENLASSTDAKHREGGSERLLHESELPVIPVSVDSSSVSRRLHAIETWIDITASGEQKAIDATELPTSHRAVKAGKQMGHTSGSRDRLGIGLLNDVKLARTGLEPSGCNADNGLHGLFWRRFGR
jgi:hypothetical protein